MSQFYHDRLKRGLECIGYREDYTSRSSKYTCLKHPSDGKTKYFIGRNGALRMGECATKSHSIGDPANQTRQYKLLLNGEMLMAIYFIKHPEERE